LAGLSGGAKSGVTAAAAKSFADQSVVALADLQKLVAEVENKRAMK